MALCPSCNTENPTASKFCAECGTELSVAVAATVEYTPIEVAGDKILAAKGPPPPQSLDHGRFEPGTRLGERYRVVGLLGTGGMGEVYRADDLELGQSVALKFLPKRLTSDPASLQRFRNEVRTARQIAHPNVCRTYDIGEVDGHVFLSMEYIDGEDLSQALRRMGRPSKEKALEIARQLCLGLAAAHEAGILHRDLKPANVMIDGRGRVRITDFGLAGLADELQESDEIAGTPAYMAPEQLSSATVSVQSDLYSLGLVFFELFTGRRVYDTNSVAELKELHSASSITSASSVSEEVDPVVDRVIQRCLEKDPQQRPSSVYAVLGALPGADPLTAALAAGETPSPELVAEAGENGIISPRTAFACLIGAMLLIILNIGLAPVLRLDHYIPLTKSADDLVFTARELLTDLGYSELPRFRAYGFDADLAVLEYHAKHDQQSGRWDRLNEADRPAELFWYRLSHEPMMGTSLHATRAFRNDPPLGGDGSTIVELDPEGKLVHLAIIPALDPDQTADVDNHSSGPDEHSTGPIDRESADLENRKATLVGPELPQGYRRVIMAAGLDPEQLVVREPVLPPAIYCDRVFAFAVPSEESETRRPILQIGAYQGRINYFQIATPWIAKSEDAETMPLPLLIFVVSVAVMVVFTAMRNLTLGRGDRRGAFRLAVFIIVTMMVGWSIDGIAASGSPGRFFRNVLSEMPIGHALQHAMIGWLLYVAAEPLARRWWPWTLVTWTRVLMGRFADVQVGRDILIGGLLAGTQGLIMWLVTQTLVWSGGLLPIPETSFLETGLTLSRVMEARIAYAHSAVIQPLALLVLLVSARFALRNQWASFLAALGITAAISLAWQLRVSTDKVSTLITVAGNIAWFAAMLFVLVRFGVFATAVGGYITMAMSAGVTWDLSVWYAAPALSGVLICVVLLAYGFYTALAGRSLFQEDTG